MELSYQLFTVDKRVPLTISRGTHHQSTNAWILIQQDGIEGWGEAVPFSIGSYQQTIADITVALDQLKAVLSDYHPTQRQAIDILLKQEKTPSAVRAAIDMALYDWLGKRANLPVWQLFGSHLPAIVPTSVTIGIGTPEAAVQRLQSWLQQINVYAVKVKLGNPAGIAADQEMVQAILSNLDPSVLVSVDANGGWSLAEAIDMAHWLSDKRISYIEQPLAVDQDADLASLYQRSPLPIFVDESCFSTQDIPRLAPHIHGINIKMMKAGGLDEVQRMIHTAKAFHLKVMFGCYSDSAIANTAMAQLASHANHLDLDSHLNLANDPFTGAAYLNGCLIPNCKPGLGLSHNAPY
jgi:L-alanine-DL-glutamate epimerase-like enolase superfamily enzyme